MLLVVAHGDNGSGDSYARSSSSIFQGSVFADDGPILGLPLSIGNSVHIDPLPPIANMPIGTPTSPNTHATVDPPVYTGG